MKLSGTVEWGLDGALLDRESVLNKEIFEKQRALSMAQGNAEEADSLKEALFDLKRQQDAVQEQIREAGRPFFEGEAVDWEEQRQLFRERDAAVLAYFEGQRNLYITAIFPDRDTFLQVPIRPGYHDTLGQFLNLFTDIRYADDNYHGPVEVKRYAEMAHRLHNYYFPPEIKAALEGITEVYLVPDGRMNSVPFDALVSEVPPSPHYYSDLPFLIRKHQFQIAFSARLLVRDPAPIPQQLQNCLAMAPFTSRSDSSKGPPVAHSSLSLLPKARRELETIQSLMPGTFVYGDSATESRFKELAKQDFSIIHLPAHASQSAIDGNPVLYFQIGDDTTNDGLLELEEVMHMGLQADLAVLSGCETGLGRNQIGEGAMSLGWAFRYSGTKEVMLSLWKIEEGATTELTQLFYEYIAGGTSPAEAIRLAKLKYLQTHEQHPIYWAGIYLRSDVLSEAGGGNCASWWLLILLAVLLYIYFRKKYTP